MPAIRTDEWSLKRNYENDHEDPTLVGQWEWCRLIPQVHHLLANPNQDIWFPRWRHDFHLDQACAYWESAYYVMSSLLGWNDLGSGLQWWYRSGLDPQGDARLELLRDLWNDQGQLVLFALWCWTHGTSQQRRPQTFMGNEFLAEFSARHAEGTCQHTPFDEISTNPLHLSHSRPDNWTDPPPPILRSDASRRQGVLVLDRARNWASALTNAGAGLPDLGGRSWHVDVVVKPIGWLGMFRRSRETGRWFQGRHAIHRAGHI